MGLGMRREIEPPGSENRLRSVGEDTERGSRGGSVVEGPGDHTGKEREFWGPGKK